MLASAACHSVASDADPAARFDRLMRYVPAGIPDGLGGSLLLLQL
ncbi:MAG TPA: hypothetical protein VK348_12095 [Planctomycetota bacterium]|nr:hypothetical protein [Planctomycetota bacterium]